MLYQSFRAIALASPVILGLVAVLLHPEPVAPIVVLPVEAPAELTRIKALQPRPIVVQVPPSGWRREQHRDSPRINVELALVNPRRLLALPEPEPEPIVSAAVATSGARRAEAVLTGQTRGPIQATTPVAAYLATQDFNGTLVSTTWTAGEALHGASIATPVLVATGTTPGPTLCVTAALHGDEINGIEAVRRLMHTIDPQKLSGRVVGVPIVNLRGFQSQSRYLSDRRDLNRFFPGNARGSSASRMAHSFFNEIIRRCDGLVDLHTGSFHRTNLPQLRADLNDREVLKLTTGFGSTVILHSPGGSGTLRRSAVDAGIPAVTLEAGEPLRLQSDAVNHSVKALFTLMNAMHMYSKRSLWGSPEPTYYNSAWVRADQGGLLLADVRLGKKVSLGDRLGTVTDPITNEEVEINAPYAGRVIGMALSQFVMPGFATFHLATEAEPGTISEDDHYTTSGLDVAVMDSQGIDESE